MGAGHSHPLYVHEHSPVHDFAPEAKVAAVLGFVVCVAITPRQAIWAFGLFAVGLGIVIAVSRVPIRFILVRLLGLTPFVLFALLVPFVASGESVEILSVRVSVPGIWGAWNILIKALLGGTASILLTATTEIPEIVRGLGLLRVPAVLTSIATFMIRYLELVADELRRMRVAMTARGFDPRWLSQARPIASSAGALFIRSYERGERVHDAMLARGFTGVMPTLQNRRARPMEWAFVALFVGMAASIAVVALVMA